QLVKGSKFLSTPSVGRATMFPVSLRIMGLFLSTPSVGRATCYCWYWGCLTGFLSTPSVGRATIMRLLGRRFPSNFYPRPPWGGRQDSSAMSLPHINFYPRPPWGGRRWTARKAVVRQFYFYPRPPWGGRRPVRCILAFTW